MRRDVRAKETVAPDVIVVGAGNVAIGAALAAHEAGADVLVLKKAGEGKRKGNTFFTGGGFPFPCSASFTSVTVAPVV